MSNLRILLKISCYYLLFNYLLCKVLCNDKNSLPPSFIHEPNPKTMYFVIEKSGATSSDSDINPSAEQQFKCQAVGHPTVAYQWLKNKKDFDLENSSISGRISRVSGAGSFIFSNLTNDDEGTYQCIAKNANGIVVDKEIKFIRSFMNQFPAIRSETFEVEFGEPFEKECLPPLSVPKARTFWILMSSPTAERRRFQTINFTNIATNEEGKIFFQYVREEDNVPQLSYTCVAENVELRSYTFGHQFNFHVTRNAARRQSLSPYILPKAQYYSPAKIVVLIGENLELFCIVAGYPDYIPKWSKLNGTIDYTRVSWTTNFNKSIKIDGVKFSDSGDYACKFEYSRLNRQFSVTVEAAPYWIDQPPKIINSSEGSTVHFICDAEGYPKPIFKFYKNGNEMSTDNDYIVEGNRLTIQGVDRSAKGVFDKAVYQCKAENKHGFVWTNFYINTTVLAPFISYGPGNVETVIGTNVTLECSVVDILKVNFTWGSSIPLGSHGRDFYWDPNLGPMGITRLQLFAVTKDKEGIYWCEFENMHDKSKSEGKLIIRNATEIVEFSEQTKEAAAGQQLEIMCKAKHDAALNVTYTWMRHGRPITNNSEFQLLDQVSGKKLILLNPKLLNSGDYTCVAETRIDLVNKTLKVCFIGAPHSPFNLAITCHEKKATIEFLSEHQAVFSQDAENNHCVGVVASTTWIVQYTIDPDRHEDWETYEIELPHLNHGIGVFNVDLFPYGKFAFRVLARNNVGDSAPAYPDTDNFTMNRCVTPPSKPVRNPDHIWAFVNTENSLIAYWEPMPRRDWYGPNFHYVVEYKQQAPTNGSGGDPPVKTATIFDPYQKSLVVKNVPSNTEFEVRVWAKNDIGSSDVAPLWTLTGPARESTLPVTTKIAT